MECVQGHVRYSRRKGHIESLSSPRMFVIYDNVEATEPGDTSDYSTVLDAPFYKLTIEDSKEPGIYIHVYFSVRVISSMLFIEIVILIY